MITSKQRAKLRELANPLDSIFQIGKGGIGEHFITQLYDALEARELVKVNVLNTAGFTAREACRETAERTGSEPVQCIGNKFVLYKKSREHQKIFLD